jgi:hypothetical protein
MRRLLYVATFLVLVLFLGSVRFVHRASAGSFTADTGPAISSTLSWHARKAPINATELTLLPFGHRSFWYQPWRAYFRTPPAQTLLSSIGINFNVPPQEVPATATVLATAGFRRARVEIGWSNMSYADPAELSNPGY